MKPLSTSDRLIPAGLIFVSLIPVAAGSARLFFLASHGPVTQANAHFAAHPLPVIAHIIAATLFCLLGAFQFSPGLRRRNLRWHRLSGRVVLPAGLIAALSGLWMALFYDIVPQDNALLHALRLTFGAAMLVSLTLGLVAILRRDVPRHRIWMMRGYAIGLGAGTQAFTNLPWIIAFGFPSPMPYALLMGAGWLINLAVAEAFVHRMPRTQVRLAPG